MRLKQKIRATDVRKWREWHDKASFRSGEHAFSYRSNRIISESIKTVGENIKTIRASMWRADLPGDFRTS